MWKSYRLYDVEDGFIVSGDGWELVMVTATPFCVEVDYPRDDLVSPDDGTPIQYSFYDVQGVSKAVLRALSKCREYDQADEWRLASGEEDARARLRESIRRRLRRFLASPDPTVLRVHRVISSLLHGSTTLTLCGAFYQDALFVGDCLRYPAAAVATAIFDRSSWEELDDPFFPVPADARDRPFPVFPPWRLPTEEEIRGALARTRGWDWLGLYSYTGNPYRSLNRTLMHVRKDRIHDARLLELRRVRLPRPIFDPLELTTLLTFIHATNPASQYCRANERLNAGIFLNARKEEIQRVFELLGTELSTNPRSPGAGEAFVRFLTDYPDAHHGNLGGLARKAIRWHREFTGDRVGLRVLRELGGQTKTRVPPITPPRIRGIRFLSTVRDLVQEGSRMHHCVAQYSVEAVGGHCYLFHVSHADAEATVQVSRTGRVVQALGPRNTCNIAAQWGSEMLRKWAAGMRSRAD